MYCQAASMKFQATLPPEAVCIFIVSPQNELAVQGFQLSQQEHRLRDDPDKKEVWTRID